MRFLRNLMKSNDGSALSEYVAVSTGCTVFFLIGVHVSWTSPYISTLQSEEYPFDISSQEASYIVISAPIGDLVGEILSTVIVDTLGRKITLVLSGIPILLSYVLIYLSYCSPVLLYLARFLGGVSFGIVMSVAPMYSAEICRPEIRAKLGVLYTFSTLFGCIAVNLIGKYLDIQSSSVVFTGIALLYLSTFSFMPETPYYFLMKGNIRGAEESLNTLRRSTDVHKELISLSANVQRQLSESGTYADLIKISSNRKALFLMILSRIFQQLTGIMPFTMYAQDILKVSRDYIEPQFAIMIVYLFQALSVIICGILADSFGRVLFLTISTASCFVTLTLQGLFFTMKDYTNFQVPSWILPVLFGVYSFLFQLGIGSLLNIATGEMFSASVKPKAICIVNITLSISILLSTKLYQIFVDYLHISYCFYTFALCSLIGSFFFKSCFVETKGKTLEEIQMDLKGLPSSDSVS